MSTKARKLRILAILVLAFIWGNSLMPGSLSSTITHFVLGLFGPIVPEASSAAGLTRKLAHILEFMAMGIVLTHLRQELNKAWSLLFLAGLGIAIIDETIQYFIEGRGSSLLDVWIDLFGFGLGVLFTHLILRRRKKNTNPLHS